MDTNDLNIDLSLIDGSMYRLKIDWRRPEVDREIPVAETDVVIPWDSAREKVLDRDMDALGLLLGDDLLFSAPKAKSSFEKAFGAVRAQGMPLRLRLKLSEDALSLPWETLRLVDYNDYGPLATTERVLVSRYVPSADTRGAGRLPPEGEWQVGVLVANPAGLEAYYPTAVDEDEKLVDEEAILNGLYEAVGANAVHRHPATMSGLRECLDQGYDALCLAALGGVRKGDKEPYVVLDDGNGSARSYTAKELAEEFKIIDDGKLPRMIVLLSCRSGGSESEGLDHSREPRLYLGNRLVEQGIPAVVAMQDNISTETAYRFLGQLFSELKEDCVIDRAMAMARRSVDDRFDWWMPVLYMNTVSGRLCRKKRSYVPPKLWLVIGATLLILLAIFAIVAQPLVASLLTEEVMTGEFNVAVADFSAVNAQGEAIESDDATEMANNLHNRLENLVNDIKLEDIDYELWSPAQTGPINGHNAEERNIAAAELADRINANVIISGVLTDEIDSGAFAPEFYVTESGFQEAAELTGRHVLGRDLRVDLPFEGIVDAQNPALVARSKALSLMTVGLAYFALSNPEKAQDYFQQALSVDGWFTSAGQEVAHLMLGKTNFLLAEINHDMEPLPTAAAHFATAEAIKPDYERAKIGQAAVTYMMAIGDPEDPREDIDAATLDQAEVEFLAALGTAEIAEMPALQARINFGLGQIYLARLLQDDFDRKWLGMAKEKFEAVIDASKNHEELASLAGHAMARLGRIAWIENDKPAAVDYYEAASKQVSPYYQARYLSYKADVLADVPDINAACQALEEAAGISETYADEESYNEYQERQADLQCPGT